MLLAVRYMYGLWEVRSYEIDGDILDVLARRIVRLQNPWSNDPALVVVL